MTLGLRQKERCWWKVGEANVEIGARGGDDGCRLCAGLVHQALGQHSSVGEGNCSGPYLFVASWRLEAPMG